MVRRTLRLETSMTATASPRPVETKMYLPSGESTEPMGRAGDFSDIVGIAIVPTVRCLKLSRTVTAAPLSAVAKAVDPSLLKTIDRGLKAVRIWDTTFRVAALKTTTSLSPSQATYTTLSS